MLLLSMGLTCGTFCSTDWILMSWTRMTMPVTCAGSRASISFSMAMMETYSVPWAPETSARTLPGLAPLTTTTGMLVAASTPAGTSRVPVDFSPGAAEAVPTPKAWASAMVHAETIEKVVVRINKQIRIFHLSSCYWQFVGYSDRNIDTLFEVERSIIKERAIYNVGDANRHLLHSGPDLHSLPARPNDDVRHLYFLTFPQ